MIEPALADTDGHSVGVALTPGIGEIAKSYLTSRSGSLAPASAESLDIALRAALDL